jgi:hypothetical protein
MCNDCDTCAFYRLDASASTTETPAPPETLDAHLLIAQLWRYVDDNDGKNGAEAVREALDSAVSRLQRERDEARHDAIVLEGLRSENQDFVVRLRSRLASVEHGEDSKRLDWMEGQQYVEATSDDPSDSGSGARCGLQWQARLSRKSLRQAIDAARSTPTEESEKMIARTRNE